MLLAHRHALLASALVVTGLAGLAGSAGGCADNGPPGPQGPQGPTGPRGPGPAGAALVGVSPSTIYTGRTTRVVVSGVNASFDDSWTVDIPLAGITTKLVQVASPDALVVDVTVPVDSVPQVRDVTASTTNTGLMLAGGITVAPPIATSFRGPITRGSVVALHLAELDPTTPILPGSGIGAAPLSVMEVLPWTFKNTGGRDLDGLVLIRGDAVLGQAGMLVDRTGDGAADDIQPDAFNVADAVPVNLTDQPTAGQLTTDQPSWYTLGLQLNRLATLKLTNTAGSFDPRMLVVGPGGGADNVLAFGGAQVSFCTPAEGTNDLVIFDANGTPSPGAGFTVTLTQTDCSHTMELEPNDDLNSANDVGPLPAAVDARFDDPDDVDVYTVKLADPTALVVETGPGMGGNVVDTTVEVIGVQQPTGEDAANDDAEVGRTPLSRVTTRTLDAGTYVIVVRMARGRSGAYTLLVRPAGT